MMLASQIDRRDALDVVESLRSGIPPRRFVSSYSVGTDQFIQDVRRRHLETTSSRGLIRFLCGHWGAGKTHLLRLLREAAFDANYLVANVELNVDQTPFHHFERVFFDIVRNISSPELYAAGRSSVAPLGDILERGLTPDPSPGRRGEKVDVVPSADSPLLAGEGPGVRSSRIAAAKARLFADAGLEVDFRRLIAAYWDTFLPDAGDELALADARARILQWFIGEGSSPFRTQYGVQKGIDRSNARLMLQSLCRFTLHLGYRGLVVLFDEAEMAYSVMRRSDLKQAHNNLLHLINSIDESEGAFLVYAATPDFFVDDRYGIVNYGALAQRIGRLELRVPNALDRVWNLDAMKAAPEDYVTAAAKIREIYLLADAETSERVMSEATLRRYVADLVALHPEFSHISTWRVVVTGTVQALDRGETGERERPAQEAYSDVMARLRAEE
ncbi:MAG: BREX system ATP-binding domain-containing protein [Chloroflexota bacterium]